LRSANEIGGLSVTNQTLHGSTKFFGAVKESTVLVVAQKSWHADFYTLVSHRRFHLEPEGLDGQMMTQILFQRKRRITLS
jgi:hypothetical protein